MDKKSLKVKIFLNLFGTYKEVCNAGLVYTSPFPLVRTYSILVTLPPSNVQNFTSSPLPPPPPNLYQNNKSCYFIDS